MSSSCDVVVDAASIRGDVASGESSSVLNDMCDDGSMLPAGRRRMMGRDVASTCVRMRDASVTASRMLDVAEGKRKSHMTMSMCVGGERGDVLVLSAMADVLVLSAMADVGTAHT